MRTKAAFLGLILGLSLVSSGGDEIKFKVDPQQRVDAPFRVFNTENIWTFLLLDTRTGRIWQIGYALNPDQVRGKFPINELALAGEESKAGTFTLYPTANMWNFLLLDQEDGRTWQVQFSMDEKNRGIIPIVATTQK